MLRFLLIGLLLYIGYRVIISFTSTKKPQAKSDVNLGSAGIVTHRDPVCGVYVSEESAIIGRHDGQRLFFCSMNCLDKYREQLEGSSPS